MESRVRSSLGKNNDEREDEGDDAETPAWIEPESPIAEMTAGTTKRRRRTDAKKINFRDGDDGGNDDDERCRLSFDGE